MAPTLNSKKEKTSTQSVVKIQPGQSFMKGLKPNLEELSESSKKTQATEKEMKPEDKRTTSEKNIFSNGEFLCYCLCIDFVPWELVF